jgi:DNA-binding LacI/PurR family transcriptional regulator
MHTVSTTPPRRRPTIDDVSSEAGVSRGTVSRVLNGGHWVSPDAHKAVTEAIKKTGYRVNPHARSLATNRANSVAFLLSEPQERLFEDPNFALLMRGAAQSLAEHDMPLVLIMAGTDAERRRATDFITAGHVDGVLLVSSHSGQRFISDILASGVPAISCGVPLGFEKKMGSVSADDLDGAQIMVAHLLETGHTRIATIAGPLDTSGGRNRLEGYRTELGDAFDERLVAQGDYSREGGAAAMRRLLEIEPRIDAVFAANDLMASGALDVALAAGIRVPDDIAIAGFDDSPVARTTTPQLTTMHQPFERISAEMVRLLVQVIEGQRPASITLPTELVVRESA